MSAVANAETADAAPSAASVRERVPDWLVLGLTCAAGSAAEGGAAVHAQVVHRDVPGPV